MKCVGDGSYPSYRVCVAEKRPVLRCLGSRAKMELRVPAKPMSRRVSASSKTKISSSANRKKKAITTAAAVAVGAAYRQVSHQPTSQSQLSYLSKAARTENPPTKTPWGCLDGLSIFLQVSVWVGSTPAVACIQTRRASPARPHPPAQTSFIASIEDFEVATHVINLPGVSTMTLPPPFRTPLQLHPHFGNI